MKNKFESNDQTSQNKVLDLNNSTRAKNTKSLGDNHYQLLMRLYFVRFFKS